MRSFVALSLIVLVAGCIQAPQPSPETAPTVEIDADRPDTSAGDVLTGPAVGPDLNATTAVAPRLVPGEWWRIRFGSSIIPDLPELVRVVGHADEEGYIIGMPHEGWYKEAIAFHAPAFGDVGPDLSYDTHNVRFEPLRFPLRQGDTWKTRFGTTEMTATVESADEFTATVRIEPPASDPQPTDPVYAALNPVGGDGSMRLLYDARQHEVVKFESLFGTWEVVEHGYGFEGWVTVPRGLHTAIDYGTFWPAGPDPPASTRAVRVDGGFNRLTMLHVVAPLAAGSYYVRSVAPDGTEFKTESSGDFMIRFYEAATPDGDWLQEDHVVGLAATYSMGMAYHQYDIRLPDGLRRADHHHAVIR